MPRSVISIYRPQALYRCVRPEVARRGSRWNSNGTGSDLRGEARSISRGSTRDLEEENGSLVSITIISIAGASLAAKPFRGARQALSSYSRDNRLEIYRCNHCHFDGAGSISDHDSDKGTLVSLDTDPRTLLITRFTMHLLSTRLP